MRAGPHALWLARQGWTVSALDFSQVAVDRGHHLAEQAGLQVNWQRADVEVDPLPEVDLVLLAYLHLPAERRRAVLGRAVAAVRPGGALLLIGHDRRNLAEGVGGPQDQDLLWTPGDVVDLGLVVVHAQTLPRPVGDRTAWDTVALLARPSARTTLPG